MFSFLVPTTLIGAGILYYYIYKKSCERNINNEELQEQLIEPNIELQKKRILQHLETPLETLDIKCGPETALYQRLHLQNKYLNNDNMTLTTNTETQNCFTLYDSDAEHSDNEAEHNDNEAEHNKNEELRDNDNIIVNDNDIVDRIVNEALEISQIQNDLNSII